VPWLIHMCAMTHSHVCHDSFTCVPWLMWRIHRWQTHFSSAYLSAPCKNVWYDSFTSVPWLIHMCAMTHSHVCHDSFTCVPWLMCVCFECATWRIHRWQTHFPSACLSAPCKNMCHDSLTCDTHDSGVCATCDPFTDVFPCKNKKTAKHGRQRILRTITFVYMWILKLKASRLNPKNPLHLLRVCVYIWYRCVYT